MSYNRKDLEKLVDVAYEKLCQIEKPNANIIWGYYYYGSTQLGVSQSNCLEIVHQYHHTRRDYYDIDWDANDCYAIKVGGAYEYKFRDIFKELLETFNYRVEYSCGKSDVIEFVDTNGIKYKASLLDEYGTNYCTYGIRFKQI